MSAFQRQRYLLDYTLSSLLRRKGKHLTLLMIYTLIIFLLASVMLFTHALKGEITHALAVSPEIVLQRIEAGRHGLISADYLQRLGRLRGVSGMKGRLWGYYYDPALKANYTLIASDEQGLSTTEVVLGSGVARMRGIGPGDYTSMRGADGSTYSFRVKSLLDNDSELYSADLVLISPKAYRTLFGIDEGLYTDIVLSVRNAREVQKIAEKIVTRLPDTRPILKQEIQRTYDAIFSWRQGILLVILIAAVSAFAIFAWDRASGLSAEERREIGILKAIGWETSDILQMKFWEGGVISLLAFLCGYLLAYLHVFYTGAPLFESVLKGWSVLYPSFSLTPSADGLQLATLFFFTVFPYVVAIIFPIWQVAITDPDAVMR
ncbi:MAG: FtsX-like permease family protein [Candidatus Thiodiazotropha sp.]|jgi:ABC-type lipoprotein release transport system permease subunit